MDSLREIVVFAVFLGLVAVFVRMIIVSVQSAVKRRSSPNITAEARVISKSAEIGSGEFSTDGIRKGKKIFSAVFLAEGKEITLQMTEKEFDELPEGAAGHLTYRENTYLGFAPDALIDAKEDQR